MPELPEVETICCGLQKTILGKKIQNVDIHVKNLRKPIPNNIHTFIVNSSIQQISRKAKYLIITLNNLYAIIMHMGMSGRITCPKDGYIASKHDHFILNFDDNTNLVYNDPRRFGLIDLITKNNIHRYYAFSKIGIEPLSESLNIKSLALLLQKSKASIKNFLINGKNIAGIGNIYASEILYKSAILPHIKVNLLNYKETRRLLRAIKEVLHSAIAAGGSTLKDYVDTDGKMGSFQNQFEVYNRQKCDKCKSKITKITQAGRSTYYCPKCQN